ncbi:DUF3489 domain-containing protein [Ralstonia nicotianae]|uniref:DUF3489 domain-containing protein n=1 Tax=Ralstonia pseudosolanacearum TaxID=1310165 RepID=UPI001F2451B8|nr:DUF3489 domain-containing protein [Ralstonia pseudosolanacearum]MCF1444408.1 DUF3489 domain-containing protein [Ralstonia solanacearum]MDO3525101.1 DUF3489 domain-containing protein [Ralstonia pseudosolanacearum]MDO3549655.1 DUF3489 domain-containing protein [Ralstonia pseudosolanacearum]MDO3554815.1 DUF3489 domain-containing protein [Ralstonia pseudosolanacearum]MDO3569478.1 DUF3489 domain-containing protein [Ralstonia pseudosolanacearum]
MTTPQLTPAQHAILAYAVQHTSGKIEWFPDNIKGGARKKVLDGLAKRALITASGDDWCVADAGYDALGRKRPTPTPVAEDPATEAAVAAPAAATKAPRTREDSKQSKVITMLRRPEGATVKQICDETGWLAHTVRGAFAGTFKKRLGLNITSHKPADGERVYRIETEDGDQSA